MWGIAMKKNRDIGKRKILKYATLSVVAMYILSLIMLFFGIFEQEAQLFYREVGQITNFSEFSDDVYYRGQHATTESFIPEYFYESYDYYSAIALYDENGELVHTNGTIISFLENHKWRYCYLDEFMSEEDYKNILKLANNGTVSCESFKYYENDNSEIIPVEIVLSTIKSKKKLWSNKKNKEEIHLKLEFSENAEAKYVASDLPIYLRMQEIDNFHNSADRFLYRKLIEQVKSEKDKEYGYKNFKNNEVDALPSGGGSIGGYDACYDIGIELLDKPYFAVVRVEFNPIIKILTDGLFYIMAVFFTVSSLIIFLIIRHYISLYYDKMKLLEAAKNTLTSATAHELKTPVAIIQNQCECILENIAPEKNELYIKSIYEETKKMNELVTNLLQFNRLSQTDKVALKECDFKNLVSEEIKKYGSSFEINEKNVTFESEDVSLVRCNRQLMSLVVDNILSNAVKHSEKGGEIKITLKKVGDTKVMLTVFNTGSHIEESKLKDVWSVMYKGDESRTDRSSSGGMGLAISAKILDLHNAYYSCKNNPDGVSFYIML